MNARVNEQIFWQWGIYIIGFLCVFFLIPYHFASASLTDGLVGHWTFDGRDTTWTSATAGTVRDVSGNGNTGTLTNMNRATSSKSGKIGQAFMFSNASVVETASSNILGTTASMSFTISGWFNVASSSINQMYIAEYGGGGAFSVEKVASSDTMRCKLRDPSAGFLYSNSVTRPQIGQWHLFSCIYNASNKTLVFDIDGSNNTPVSVSAFSTYDNPGKLFFGNRSYGTHPFMGSLDNIRVYNRALSVTEIQQLYKLGGGKTGVTQTRNVTASTSPLCTGISCGLVGHWTFDGKDTTWTSATAGTVRDASGNGNTGTFANVNRGTSIGLGKMGQGFKFYNVNTGTRVYKSNPNGMSDMTSFTVSAWLKQATTTNERTVFYLREVTSKAWSVGLSGTNIRFTTHGACTGTTFNSGTITDITQWHHVVWKVDGTTYSIYKDGVLQGSTTGSPECTFTTPESAEIGSTWSRYFDGTLDDVRIYNRALSATEIQQLYKLGGGKTGVTQTRNVTASTSPLCTGISCGLVGHWTFDGKNVDWASTTAEVRDSSGNRNNGNTTNMTASNATAGKVGQGMRFSSTSATYVSVNHNTSLDIDNTESLTVSLWFKSSGVDGVNRRNLFGKSSTTQNIGYGCFQEGGSLYIACRLRNATIPESSTQTYQANKWYHFIYRIDGEGVGTGSVYLNGVSQSSISLSDVDTSNSGYFGIGTGAPISGTTWDGGIDDVRVYNRALSATEIQQLYKVGQRRVR